MSVKLCAPSHAGSSGFPSRVIEDEIWDARVEGGSEGNAFDVNSTIVPSRHIVKSRREGVTCINGEDRQSAG